MKAVIRAGDYYLPGQRSLNSRFGGLDEAERLQIEDHLGIREKHIAQKCECASDLAVGAAAKLFDTAVCRNEDIDFILFCTQSPGYFLPTTACLIQDRLGVATSAGAVDINLGCSGFVHCLSLAKALIESGLSRNLLLLTVDTYSKYLLPQERFCTYLKGAGNTVSSVIPIALKRAWQGGRLIRGMQVMVVGWRVGFFVGGRNS